MLLIDAEDALSYPLYMKSSIIRKIKVWFTDGVHVSVSFIDFHAMKTLLLMLFEYFFTKLYNLNH